jgi:hypothetical protein
MRSARHIHMYDPELELLIRAKESNSNSGRVWLGVAILFLAALVLTGGK